MQPENCQTIKDTLIEALTLDPSGRRAYLENANISAEVRAEVESLLTQENNAKDFMSLTASSFARELFDGSGNSADPLINQKIGQAAADPSADLSAHSKLAITLGCGFGPQPKTRAKA